MPYLAHQNSTSYTNRKKFLLNRIIPSITAKSCPICFTELNPNSETAVLTVCRHAYCVGCIRKWSELKRKCPLCNAEFDSWFCGINVVAETFRTEELRVGSGRVGGRRLRRRRDGVVDDRGSDGGGTARFLRRQSEELNPRIVRARPLPRRRWFGQSSGVTSHLNNDQVLRWRASIYEQHLQAVPCSTRNTSEQDILKNICAKEKLLQRVEPWIRRELHAILGDPDPTVIVHLVTSLFISSLENIQSLSPGESVVEDNYVEPLRAFLFEKTNIFWHELRCFAESILNMETYDTVVEYVESSN